MHSSRILPGAVLGLAALACCGAAGAKSLYPSQFINTVNSPGSVVLADVNGDGFPDVVEIGADGTVAVLLNKGDGTFDTGAHFYVTDASATGGVAPSPQTLAVKDVNGDGKPDIVVVNNAAATVSVLLGNDDGTFKAQTATEAANGTGTAAPTYAVGKGVISVALADLNGDGFPDIITADYTDNTVSVLLNKGNGTFSTRTVIAVGTGPDFVTVGDFNNDGKADVVVSDSGDNAFNLLLGKGDGSFTVEPEVRVAARPAHATLQMVVVGDFDHDGNLDVISTNTDPNSDVVVYYPGKGDGSFGTPYAIATGLDTLFLQAVALKGSGTELGLIAGNVSSSTLRTLFGNGRGGFVSGAAYPAYGLTTSLATQAFAAADVNGDGKPDIVTVNSTGNLLQVMYNDGTGHFHLSNSYTLGSGPADVQSADLNGDGHADVVEANSADGTVGVLLGNGDGTFQPMQTYAVGGHPQRLVLADVDGDGNLDVVTANNDGSGGTVSVLLGVGNGTFQPARHFSASANPVDVAVADMDRDGKQDIVVANSVANTVSILYGSGSVGNPNFSAPVPFPAGSQINALAVGDVNQDGFPDVVTVGSNVAVLRNNGAGASRAGQIQPITLNQHGLSQDVYSAIGSRVILADINGDHNPDILIADHSNSQLTVLLGNRLGYFSRIPFESQTCGNPDGLAAADVNGDGRVDVVVSCAGSSAVGVLLGNGSGSFMSNSYAAELDPRAVVIADFNQDGNPDIAVANGGSDNMNVMLQIPGVAASDHAPKAIDEPLVVPNGAKAFSSGFAATDADGDPLTFVLVSPPADGTVIYSSTSGAYSYLAAVGFVGSDSMTFQVSDGVKISNIGTVRINVQSNSGGGGGGKHGFLGAFWLAWLPVLGLFAALRRRRQHQAP